MLKLFKTVFAHDLKLYFSHRMDIVNAVLFFLLTVILFPIAVGQQPTILRELGYGVIWVSAIFSSMFGIRLLFEPDYEDGTIGIYQTTPHSFEIIVFAKILANWVAFCLPVVLVSPLAAAMFWMVPSEMFMIFITLLFATPTFVMVGAIGAAISLGSKKGRIMLSLLVVPFYIPVLIFGVNTSRLFVSDMTDSYSQSLMILGGGMLLSFALSTWVSSFVMKED